MCHKTQDVSQVAPALLIVPCSDVSIIHLWQQHVIVHKESVVRQLLRAWTQEPDLMYSISQLVVSSLK